MDRIKKSLRKKLEILAIGLRRRLRPFPITSSVGKILIIHLDPLGDTALLVAYLRAIGLRATDFDLCCLRPLAPFWEHFFPGLQIFPFPTRSWHSEAQRQLCKILQRHSYDAVILPCVSPTGAYLAACAHSPHRYGWIEAGRYFSGSRWLLSSVYNAPAKEHVVTRFRKLFGRFNPKWQHLSTPLSLPRSDANEIPQSILFHPGGKWKPRRWPPERYLELSSRLEQKGFSTRFLIHRSEQDLFDFFSRHLPHPSRQLVITETIPDLLNALEQSQFFIGNDSGPAHCAALMQMPTLVLWGPADEARIRPIGNKVVILKKDIDCRPCQQYIFPDRCERGENLCLQWISVDEAEHTFLRSVLPLVRAPSSP